VTDIVERLRKENSMPPYYGVPKLQDEAAAEIERQQDGPHFQLPWDKYPGTNKGVK